MDTHDVECGCPECWEPPEEYQEQVVAEIRQQLTLAQLFAEWEPDPPPPCPNGEGSAQ